MHLLLVLNIQDKPPLPLLFPIPPRPSDTPPKIGGEILIKLPSLVKEGWPEAGVVRRKLGITSYFQSKLRQESGKMDCQVHLPVKPEKTIIFHDMVKLPC